MRRSVAWATFLEVVCAILLLAALIAALLYIFNTPEASLQDEAVALDQKNPELPNTVNGSGEQEQTPAGADEGPRFVKIDAGGAELSPEAGEWSCVFDRSTGLLWEVKRTDGGLQDAEHTYSWAREGDLPDADAEPDTPPPGGSVYNRGLCLYSECDTAAYVREVQEISLCGASNWRLPEAAELRTLEHPTRYYPDIDTDFFPNTISGNYWTSTEVEKARTLAWSVDFNNGFPYIAEKRLAHHLRLTSGPVR
ncbi:DUF1566 domain-containing protein [Hahella sp. CR1]|uniref:Lcl C-terminal domain-containing protein n=1 Tax=Hahella sp. CR1 TaxID=2992807 RepID=UPI002441F537|nr:DUF1566 domain-containing protein [Hahella sp. CR1]MDG9666384.1 DUF1566 domain-containing protein [Hahella sp. CR1]